MGETKFVLKEFLPVNHMESPIISSPVNVLLAEDDTLMHEMVMHALDDAIFKVTAVENGRHALELFSEKRWDLVLLDVDMPVLDGFETCRQIRLQDGGANVPIVMITGLDDIASIEKAYLSGADDFITKPITWPTLGQRLAYLHRGNQALLKVQAQMRSEQALYEAIPDSIVIFDSKLQVLKLHKGAQAYLFADLDEKNKRASAVIAMLTEVLGLADNPKDSGCQVNNFTEKVTLAGKSYYLECRKARRQKDENIIVIRDISQRKQDEEKITTLVFYDPLTGLPNRTYLKEQLARDIASCQRSNAKLALLFLNIRAFAKINDTLGITLADELLLEVSKRLAGLLRSYDVKARARAAEATELSRFAGDEFAVILRDVVNNQDIRQIAERLSQAMQQDFIIQGHKLVVDLYIGCSLYPADAQEVCSLIAAADSAKYQNKQEPSLPISFYDACANESVKREHLIESKLRQALEHQELSLVIQPKFNLERPELLSGELLLRWFNRDLGQVSPAEFIPIAEQSGMIIDISKWVLEQGCSLARQLQFSHDLTVQLAINISPRMFMAKEKLTQYLCTLLERYQMPASRFELEITEYVLMHYENETANTLAQLQEMGIALALDDFGTGYASLSYLTQLDLDTLKIDRIFVSTLDSERSQKLVRSIIAMARQLGIQVVAEGVETRAQLEFLQEVNCDYAQGFFLAKPMAITDYIRLMQQEVAGKQPLGSY